MCDAREIVTGNGCAFRFRSMVTFLKFVAVAVLVLVISSIAALLTSGRFVAAGYRPLMPVLIFSSLLGAIGGRLWLAWCNPEKPTNPTPNRNGK